MSTKAIRVALNEAIENGEDYAEQCEHEGRRKEAQSVRHTVERARKALAEVEAIEKACLTLYQTGVVQNEQGEEHETTPALDNAADYLMNIGMEQTS